MTATSWNAGYAVGMAWTDDRNWVPGGPVAYDKAGQKRREAWQAGWKAGNDERLRRRQIFYDDEQHAGGFGDGSL